MKSPVIFYHLWPVGEWERVNKNIFSKIVESGLSNSISKMYICVNSDIDFSLIELHNIPSEKVEFIRVPNTNSEWPTLDKMYSEFINEKDVPILYLHCKGARFTEKDFTYKSVISWVDGMSYYNVTKWRSCISYLEQGRLSVGIRVARMPVPHYSGNFWWINSNSLSLLINPKTTDHSANNRYGAEFWIGRLGINNLFDVDMKRLQFNYNNVISTKEYVDSSITNKGICMYKIGNNDCSWANRYGIRVDVYKKEENTRDSRVSAYVRYIIDNYNSLPKYVYFLTSNSVNINNIEYHLKSNYERFHPIGYGRVTDDSNGLPNHPGLPIKEIWEGLFETECPEKFQFTPGSSFGLSSKEIKKYSYDFYIKLLKNIDKYDKGVEDYCFERMWESFFTLNLSEIKQRKKVNLEKSLTSSSNDVDFFIKKLPDFKFEKINIVEIGADIDGYWNKILSNISSKKSLIMGGDVVQQELEKLIQSNYSINNNNSSEFVEFSFCTWNAILVDNEILIKNRSKKKTFIQAFVNIINTKLL